MFSRECRLMPPRAQKVSKKQGDTDKRYLIGLRLGHDARVRLEKAAAESGRSLAAEAEARLEWSFRSSENPEAGYLQLKFGQFFGVMLAAGIAADHVGRWVVRWQDQFSDDERLRQFESRTPMEDSLHLSMWASNPAAYQKAVEVAIQVMQAFKPADINRDDTDYSELDEVVPGSIDNLLKLILTEPRYAAVRSALGDLIDRIPSTAEAAPRSRSDPE
jgi:hypothetical protein